MGWQHEGVAFGAGWVRAARPSARPPSAAPSASRTRVARSMESLRFAAALAADSALESLSTAKERATDELERATT